MIIAKSETYYVPYEMVLYEFSSPKTVGDFVRGFSWRKAFVYRPEIIGLGERKAFAWMDFVSVGVELPYWLHTFYAKSLLTTDRWVLNPMEMQKVLFNLSKIRYLKSGKILQRLELSERGYEIEKRTLENGKVVYCCYKDIVIPPDFFKIQPIPTEIDPSFWG